MNRKVRNTVLAIIFSLMAILMVIEIFQILGNKKETKSSDIDSVIDEESGIEIFYIQTDDIYAFSFNSLNQDVLEFKRTEDGFVFDQDKSVKINQDLIQNILDSLCHLYAISILNDTEKKKISLDTEITYELYDAVDYCTKIVVLKEHYNDNRLVAINDDYNTLYEVDESIINIHELMFEDIISFEQ